MLTRDEQRLAHAFDGWMIVRALLDTLDPDHREYGGWSHAHERTGLGQPGDWLEYNTRHIVLGPLGCLRTPRTAHLTLTWAAIAKHGTQLPTSLRDRLTEWDTDHSRYSHHGTRLPHYAPDMDIVRRWALDAMRHGHRQWWLRLGRELDQLLDEAFPLANDDEPADLLELLEASA